MNTGHTEWEVQFLAYTRHHEGPNELHENDVVWAPFLQIDIESKKLILVIHNDASELWVTQMKNELLKEVNIILPLLCGFVFHFKM